MSIDFRAPLRALVFLALLSSQTAFASTLQGYVEQLIPDSRGFAQVSMASSSILLKGSIPACGTQTSGPNKRYSIDLSNVGGRAIYQSLIAAKAIGQTVTLYGANEFDSSGLLCWAGSERVVWAEIQ